MSLAFLAGLWALAGLAVPLAIHLIRRNQSRVVDFAAMRWLRADPRPRRRLRVRRPWLLAVRLLLITLLALLLAGLSDRLWPSAGAWQVVVPGVADAVLAELRADSPSEVEARWLAPGFPSIDQPMPDPAASASLLRELDARLPPEARLMVWLPDHLAGLDGVRPMLSRGVEWRVVAAAPRRLDVSADVGAGSVRPSGSDRLGASLIAFDHARAAERRYLHAALTALAVGDRSESAPMAAEPAIAGSGVGSEWPLADTDADLDLPALAGIEVLFWLSDRPWPSAIDDWLRGGGRILHSPTENSPLSNTPFAGEGGRPPASDCDPIWHSRRTGATVCRFPVGAGRVVRLSVPLTSDRLPELVEPDFPELLSRWLSAAQPAPSLGPATAFRPSTGGPAPHPIEQRLDHWLILLIALVFLVERWLASSASVAAGSVGNAPARPSPHDRGRGP
ncbi:MAG TPA: hypothetical protein DDZ76_15810 [Xanthomonadales bacterium]|nr:hypothetical protein [Xanthomonadales bacterium]